MSGGRVERQARRSLLDRLSFLEGLGEDLLRLRGIGEQQVHLGGAHKGRINDDVFLPVQPQVPEGDLYAWDAKST